MEPGKARCVAPNWTLHIEIEPDSNGKTSCMVVYLERDKTLRRIKSFDPQPLGLYDKALAKFAKWIVSELKLVE